MLEFGAIPPEINSARMYAGPGSGPMIAASAAWDALADDLYLTAVAYRSTITDLTSSWLGPSSQSMGAAAGTYVSWISATAMHAEETAAQAKAAVAAYEAAFGMTVPPPVIAANRALLLALVATNFFGQNTPAIMATEADYVEMWAQDATAMYGYAGASSAASALIPFTAPVPTTSSGGGLTGLAAAATQVVGTTATTGMQVVSQLTSVLSTPLTTAAMPSTLQGLASAAATSLSSSSPLSALTTTMTSSSTVLTSGTSLASGITSSASVSTSSLSAPSSAMSLMYSLQSGTSALGTELPAFESAFGGGWGPGAGALGSPDLGGAVTANAGRAASLGALSVPEGWTSAAPAFSQVASAVPGGASPLAATPPVMPGGQGAPVGPPLSRQAGRQGARARDGARYSYRPAVFQRPVYTG